MANCAIPVGVIVGFAQSRDLSKKKRELKEVNKANVSQ